MAGIGFKIQKVLERDSYFAALQGYLFGSFVAAGPLLTIALCIGTLTLLSQARLTPDEFELFQVTLVYVYATSLLLIGLIQMPATRYVADCLFGDENAKVLPNMLGMLLLGTAAGVLVGLFCFTGRGLGSLYVFRAVCLLILVTDIWVAMIFITATRHFLAVACTFLVGSALSVGFGHIMGKAYAASATTGLNIGAVLGYLDGCAIGQAFILMALIAIIVREFPCKAVVDFEFFGYFKRFPELLAAGFLFNLGWWGDKILLWLTMGEATRFGQFKTFSYYDSVGLIAYLTVIPALTVFFIRVETSFYLRYRSFFKTVTNRGSLFDIEEARDELLQDLGNGISRIFWLQLTVTALCLICSTPIMEFFHLNPIQWSMFRISLIGAMLILFVQLLMTAMLYFEFRMAALTMTAVFSLGNILFSWAAVTWGGFGYIGYGFTAASLLSLAVGWILAEKNFGRLVYLTFTSQPIPKVE